MPARSRCRSTSVKPPCCECCCDAWPRRQVASSCACVAPDQAANHVEPIIACEQRGVRADADVARTRRRARWWGFREDRIPSSRLSEVGAHELDVEAGLCLGHAASLRSEPVTHVGPLGRERERDTPVPTLSTRAPAGRSSATSTSSSVSGRGTRAGRRAHVAKALVPTRTGSWPAERRRTVPGGTATAEPLCHEESAAAHAERAARSRPGV